MRAGGISVAEKLTRSGHRARQGSLASTWHHRSWPLGVALVDFLFGFLELYCHQEQRVRAKK